MTTDNGNQTLNVEEALQKLEALPKDLHRLFKSTQDTSFIFSRGKYAHFVRGRYLTKIPSEIAELDAEIAQGNPHIYVDPNEYEVDKNLEDPHEAVKRQAIKDYLVSLARATNPENDAGKSVQGPLNVTSSESVAAAAQGGSGSQLTGQLASLLKNINPGR